jgi:hypothetical protein
MTVLDLDDTKNLQNSIVENNIKYVIKNYSTIEKNGDKSFNKYYKKYNINIKFKKKIINMNIFIKNNFINNKITYHFLTIEDEENDKNWYNVNDQTKDKSGWPGVYISFLYKDCYKNDSYIDYIAKNEKQKIDSGTNAIKLAIRLSEYLNVRYAYLQDASRITCEGYRDLSLSLFKLLTTGNTWYEKHGFTLDVKEYKNIRSAIEKVRKIKITDVIKTVKKIRDALQNTIITGKFTEFKCWSPFASGMAVHRTKWLSNKYEIYANNYLLLNKNKKKEDTIESYSNRVGINNCKDYIDTIQKLLFIFSDHNNSEHMLVINYKDKWIHYPCVDDIYKINLLLFNYDIKYKKKIRA